MAVSYVAALQTTRMNAVVTAIDVNASPATLEIGTAAMAATLVAITLADPSFTVAGTPAVATMAGVPKSGTATGTGTAAAARIKDGGGNVIVSGLSVGTSGTDIVLNSVAITAAQVVTLTAGTITHSA